MRAYRSFWRKVRKEGEANGIAWPNWVQMGNYDDFLRDNMAFTGPFRQRRFKAYCCARRADSLDQ